MSEEIQTKNLRPIWDVLLETYKVFASICDRHNLRYCADCGTALGAVRHAGFIPWDDDLDIQMPRPDYQKFASIAQKELPSGYAWLDRFNCSEYDNMFGKVIVSDSDVINRIAKESGFPLGSGIFIDVFPVDGYPDTFIGQCWRRFQNTIIRIEESSIRPWKEKRTVVSKILYVVGRLMRMFTYKIHCEMDRKTFYERRARKLPWGSTKMCASIGLADYWDDKPYPHSFFGTPQRVPFEDTEMVVHEDVEGYLRWMFDDYLTLPPVEERISTHVAGTCCPWRLGPDHCVELLETEKFK